MNKINNILILGTSFIVFLLLLVSCSDKTVFEVKGQLNNVSGDYFLAAREITSQQGDSLQIDTIAIDAKGKFTFTGTVDTLTVITLYFNENTKSTYLLVDKGWKVEVKGDVLLYDLIRIKGGDINDDLSHFKETNKVLLLDGMEILSSMASKTKEDSIRSKEYIKLKNIYFDLTNIAETYIKNNPDKIASVMLIDNFFRDESDVSRLDENLQRLEGKAKTFPLALSLRRYSNKIRDTAIGSMAPDIRLKNWKGKPISLYSNRGKNILLSFVGTTCEMCNQERPTMVNVYKRLKKKKANIEFITILLDNEIETLPKDTLATMNWIVAPDYGSWAAKSVEQYHIHEIPYNILISPAGEILERNISIYLLEEKLKAREIID